MIMEEWFRTAEPKARDAMTACILEYRFDGDPFSKWWPTLQEFDFQYVPSFQKYSVPFGPGKDQKIWATNEIYKFFDTCAVPRLTSLLQSDLTSSPLAIEDYKYGQMLRKKVIFHRFKNEILAVGAPSPESTERKKSSRQTKSLRRQAKRKANVSVTASEPGAELFLKKAKKQHLAASSAEEVQFPSDFRRICKEFSERVKPGDYDEQFATHFGEWCQTLAMGSSLVLYGVGCKRGVLNRFADEELAERGDVMVVDGCDGNANVDDLLDSLVDWYLGGREPEPNSLESHYPLSLADIRPSFDSVSFPTTENFHLVQRAISISKAIANQAREHLRPLYLVIHSLDAAAFRSDAAEEALAALVDHSYIDGRGQAIHLVATFDHVNYPTVSFKLLSHPGSRFSWKSVHTYAPYVEEVPAVVEKTRKKRVSSRRSTKSSILADSIFNVLSSLVRGYTSVVQELAKLQIDQAHDNSKMLSEVWIPHKTLLTACFKKCIISTERQLRDYESELVDQGLLAKEKVDGKLCYNLPFSREKLMELLAFQHGQS